LEETGYQEITNVYFSKVPKRGEGRNLICGIEEQLTCHHLKYNPISDFVEKVTLNIIKLCE